MKVIKRLLASFLIIVLLENIMTFNIYAVEDITSETTDIYSETEQINSDFGDDDIGLDNAVGEEVNNIDNSAASDENAEFTEDMNNNDIEEVSEDEITTIWQEETQTERETAVEETQTERETVVEETESVSDIVNEEITTYKYDEDVTENINSEEEVCTETVTEANYDSSGENKEESTETTTIKVVFGGLDKQPLADEILFTLSVELNGGTITEEGWTLVAGTRYSKSVLKGSSVLIGKPVQTGAVFLGWATEPDSYIVEYPGDIALIVNNDITLYAVWDTEEYNVSFIDHIGRESLWEVNIEYGYEFWKDKNTPWKYIQPSSWTTDENNVTTATVYINDKAVEVTRNTNRYNEKDYTYYTFYFNNKKYFTVADEINTEKQGYTFRDWYMLQPEAGGSSINADSVFLARYLNTNSYIANLDFRYANGKTAAPSRSEVLSYDSSSGTYTISIGFTAGYFYGYLPIITSTSNTGVYLVNSDNNDELIGADGLDDYTAINTDSTDAYYSYTVKIDIETAAFTVLEGGDGDNGKTYCVGIDIIYKPAPTGYTIKYFREVLGSDSTQHTGEFELYGYDEVEYSQTDNQWIVRKYEARAGSKYNTASRYTLTDNQGNEVVCYNHRTRNYELKSESYITEDYLGVHIGDTIHPEEVKYEGFIISSASAEIVEEGFDIVTQNQVQNLFYSRQDFHIYYISGSESSVTSNMLYVYGGTVADPPEVTRTGYSLNMAMGTKGWVYYEETAAGETPRLLNGNGLKPDTMPAQNIYVSAYWIKSDTHYTVNVWLEAANEDEYYNVFGIEVPSITGTELNIQNLATDIKNGVGIASSIDNGFPEGMRQHFTFNEDYTITEESNANITTVKADGTTIINVLYNRNWYTLEFVLGRISRRTYQLATGTNGGFSDCYWSDSGGNNFPVIYTDDSKIETVDTANATYYKLKNGIYSVDGTKYKSAYSYYTTKRTIYGFTCASYFIRAKYDADISDLWLANGNSVSLIDPDSTTQDYGGFTTNRKYVSLGPDGDTKYRADRYGKNQNILNIYATMSDEILFDDSDNIMTRYSGYDPGVDVNGDAVYQVDDVNHRMVAYWGNPSTFRYYFVYEILDGTIDSADYTITTVNNTGVEVNRAYRTGDVIYCRSQGKYYIVDSTTTQYTTAAVSDQNQPQKQGFVSLGKAHYSSGSDNNIYFFYNREVYDVTIQNVGTEYFPPTDVINVEFTKSDGTVSTLKKEGVGVNAENGNLTVKFGGDFSNIEYLNQYLMNYRDATEYDNKGRLCYPIMTKGEGQWTFDMWYKEHAYVESAWNSRYTHSAYTAFTIYSKWNPPEYNLTFHIGRGSWSGEHKEGYIWRDADETDAEYYNRKADIINANTYRTAVEEGDHCITPYSPGLYGYRFIGWTYFDESVCQGDDCTDKVYIDTIIDKFDSVDNYDEGYTYYDYYNRARLIHKESGSDRLYYCNKVRGLRYIFNSSSPMYNDVDVYAVWQSYDSEQYNVEHIVAKADLDAEGITVEGYDLITINGTEYYRIKETAVTGKRADSLYTVSADYGLSIKSNKNGVIYNLLPENESIDITLKNTLYNEAVIDNNTITYSGNGNISYVKTADDKYIYYVFHKYNFMTEIPYKVWYIDIDEAIRSGELTDENGSHPYYTRYETPDTKNRLLFVETTKTQNIDASNNIQVSETAKDVPGYTVMGEWQTQLSLIAEEKSNNIFFYYRKQTNDSVYDIKYYLIDENGKYSEDNTVIIKNMPGVAGLRVKSEILAWHNDRYIYDAVNGTPLEGYPVSIEITQNGNKYYYNVAGQTDTADIVSIGTEMLKGTVNNKEMSTPYILVANNEANYIEVYLKYGSINVKKLDNTGNALEGAHFTLAQYMESGDNITPTGVEYTGITDVEGQYLFKNLQVGDGFVYMIKETTAPSDNYSLLIEPIKIELPFASEQTLNGDYDYAEDGMYYWYDISCEVTDNIKFEVPLAGGKPYLTPVTAAGMALIYISLMLILKRK